MRCSLSSSLASQNQTPKRTQRRMGEVQVVVGPIVIRLPGPLRAPALVPVVGAQIGHHNDDLLRSKAALLQRLQVGMTPQTSAKQKRRQSPPEAAVTATRGAISRVEEAALRTAEAAKPRQGWGALWEKTRRCRALRTPSHRHRLNYGNNVLFTRIRTSNQESSMKKVFMSLHPLSNLGIADTASR